MCTARNYRESTHVCCYVLFRKQKRLPSTRTVAGLDKRVQCASHGFDVHLVRPIHVVGIHYIVRLQRVHNKPYGLTLQPSFP